MSQREPERCPLCGQYWWACGETMCPQPKARALGDAPSLIGSLDNLYQTAYDNGFKDGQQSIAVKWQDACDKWEHCLNEIDYLRGIRDGNIVPTIENLRAALRAVSFTSESSSS